MPTTITASLQSESVTDGDSSKSQELGYIITAVDSAAPTVGIAITSTEALSALAAIGSTVTIGGQTAKVTSRSVEAVADAGKKVWTGTVSYAWAVNETNDFVSLDMNTTMSFVDVYRMGASFPASINAPGDNDIGGGNSGDCDGVGGGGCDSASGDGGADLVVAAAPPAGSAEEGTPRRCAVAAGRRGWAALMRASPYILTRCH